MIRSLTRQIRNLREGNAGQALPLVLVTLLSLLSLAFATVYVSHLGASRVGASRAIDAIALSAATWEARGLNLIAALNDGVMQCIRVIRWIVAAWSHWPLPPASEPGCLPSSPIPGRLPG